MIRVLIRNPSGTERGGYLKFAIGAFVMVTLTPFHALPLPIPGMLPAFDWTATTDEVLAGIDLRGRRALVTGVSAGLGVETARALAAHGAVVVGTARDLSKAEQALREAGAWPIELVEVDLASLASVRAAADKMVDDGRPFDLVIANAGVMGPPMGHTVDGFETQFGTNHLGHFVLVNRIAPLIRNGGRVVSLASSGHRFADVDLDDPNFERTPYDPYVAYGRSKTANVLFAVEFDRRHRDRGIRAIAVHPGGIMTELVRHMTDEQMQMMADNFGIENEAGEQEIRLKTIPQGAATSIWACVTADADLVGGRYCEDCRVATPTDSDLGMGDNGVRPYALDPERAKALWALSEQMVGETF
jgi:NAD(P)-dependent dehydrogenase (short-subunit alcohol dehydrogenase family)